MADKNYPLVSVVVLNWNGLEDTKLCLEYVDKLDYPNIELIVVDNGSKADQKEYLSKLKNITYIDNPRNRGFAGGHIDGYKVAKGEFILLLNNDAVIKSNYLKEALPLFDDPEVAAVGGRAYFWNDDEPLMDTSNRFYSYMNIDPISAETHLQMTDYGVVQEVNTVSGSAVVVRKSVADKLGYLWEDFFAYYEETDLFARYKRAGYKILYNPKLHIWHKNGASSGAQSGSYFFYYHIFRNRYMYAMRNFDDEFLAKFKKDYYSLARRVIADAPYGKSQRALAKAYSRAILDVRRKKPELLKDRLALKSQLGDHSYSKQIIREQTAISVIVDCSAMSKKELVSLAESLRIDRNPIHEYILVTRLSDKIFRQHSSGVRYVIDRGYFKSHSVNLGCLAARHDWMALCTPDSLKSPDYYLNLITNSYTQHPSLITIGKQSVIISKGFFELVGGLQASPDSLEENVADLSAYAHLSNSLFGTFESRISPDTKEKLLQRITNDKLLLSTKVESRWQRLLNRYYRLQQLDNLTRWSINPAVPIRLKLGRTKNLVLFTFTLNRKLLATELRHVRNELLTASRDKASSRLQSRLEETSKMICSQTVGHELDIPVFIVCFERVNDLKKLVARLESTGVRRIVFIDNDSTYEPLLRYYDNTAHQVIKLQRNEGHTAPWSRCIVRTLTPESMYIVTDPDVLPDDNCPDDFIDHMLDIHLRYPAHKKVGLGLDIKNIPDKYPLKKQVIEWESQFWKTELEPGVFEAGVDTTFALYKPFTFTYTLHPSIRLAEPYTARHMPWYKIPGESTDEDTYYKLRASGNITSWTLDELPDRYIEEMESDRFNRTD